MSSAPSEPPACAHLRQIRYGRTDDTGDAVVEVRCRDCERTLAVGR